MFSWTIPAVKPKQDSQRRRAREPLSEAGEGSGHRASPISQLSKSLLAPRCYLRLTPHLCSSPCSAGGWNQDLLLGVKGHACVSTWTQSRGLILAASLWPASS